MVGRTILQYQFLEKLGSGGMGDIYKAQDTRLNRYVAIKVLNSFAGGDPDQRRRFIQEAQAASALNHPNIITIHDILTQDGTDFMVLEFVSGRTLVDLIPKNGLSVAQVFKYSVQMADALQAAHSAGIVHRDLKPGNVMVTDSGLVKILDFGLAKLTDRDPLTTSLSGPDEATKTIAEGPLTVEGSIIGTVSYMSPEQAQGKKVDTRSDIFSFGVVLYEMVTGSRAFHGDSIVATLSAILRDEARPVAEFAPEAPPQLEMVIRRCVKKSPDQRWQTMKDVQMALSALKHESDSGSLYRARLAEPPPPPPSGVHAPVAKKGLPAPVLLGVAGGLALLLAIGGSVWWRHRHAPPPVETAAVEAPAPEPTPEPPPANPEPGAAAAAAVAPPTPPVDEAMTNDQVIQMVEGKVSPSLIIGQIRSSKTSFVLTPSEVIRLSKAGVSDKIVEAMRDPKRASAASSPAQPAPKATPKQEQPAAPSAAVTQPTPPPQPQAPAQPSPAPIVAANSANPAISAPQAPAANIKKVTVPDTQGFKIRLTDDILESAPEGGPLHFTAIDDVVVDGSVVIAKGASVSGALAPKRKVLGGVFGGNKMMLKVTSVSAVDGHPLAIRAVPSPGADGAVREVDTGKSKPKGVAATAGTEYYAYVDGAQVVSVHK